MGEIVMTADSEQMLSSKYHQALGLKYRKNSIIFGVIGLFIFGIGFGAFAFITARKAESEGVKATAGKVLGIVDFITGIITTIIFFKTR